MDPSYKDQSIDLPCNLINQFLFDDIILLEWDRS